MMNAVDNFDEVFDTRTNGVIDNFSDNESENYIITDSLDVDVNLDVLRASGITEEEIDEMFDINDKSSDSKTNDKKKKRQADIDIELVKAFVDTPTHKNFNKLWERFYFGVKGHAFKFMRDWDMADDIACQTFTRAWEYKDNYDIEKAKFSTWLYTICRNLCLAEINRKKKENCVPNDISDMFDSAMLTNSAALSTDSTQYTVEKGEVIASSAADLLERMYDTSLNEIQNMGGKYAQILRMKLVDNMKIREISNILHINESTVKNYLYKGKENLEEIMKTKHKSLYEMYLESSADEASKII